MLFGIVNKFMMFCPSGLSRFAGITLPANGLPVSGSLMTLSVRVPEMNWPSAVPVALP